LRGRPALTIVSEMPARSSRNVALALVAALLAAWLLAVAPVLAKDGGDRREARATGTCVAGATAKLRLRSRDGTIAVRFDVKRSHSRETWRVVLVHERRVVWRGNARTRSSGFRVERSIDDFSGPDAVTARASGPRGMTCEASATLPG
jgi:hypothetical protein